MTQLPRTYAGRLKHYDYATPGLYFVTICTDRRAQVFGRIEGATVILSSLGEIAASCWREIPEHRPEVILDAWVVMPNHLHGILGISGTGTNRRARRRASGLTGPAPGSLSAVVRSFKAATTREIRLALGDPDRRVWQPRFYERIIRDDRGLEAARSYVVGNPAMWDRDPENPASRPGSLTQYPWEEKL